MKKTSPRRPTKPAGRHAITSRRVKQQTYTVVVERDEDGYYVGSVPELYGCHTQARSMPVLMDRIKEAIELCVEYEATLPKEERSRSKFIGVRRVAV